VYRLAEKPPFLFVALSLSAVAAGDTRQAEQTGAEQPDSSRYGYGNQVGVKAADLT